MLHEAHLTYPPLNTLKCVDDDVWIVDGPVIRLGGSWLSAPFPTRATILRLDGRDLFVHSPTPLVAELRVAIERTGIPRWIIGPNRLHYWWIPEWRAAYPDAKIYLAPKTKLQAGDRLAFECHSLERPCGYPWDGQIATLPIAGRYMTEVEFFHRRSRTLVLTDLIENFESKKIDTLAMRFLTWAGAVRDPDGSTPRDLRMSFWRNRPQLKAAIETMIEWNPERIILAHGRYYDHGGRAELQRAFRWILK
jgi:hypothetical protein